MKIGLVSDTHRMHTFIDKIIPQLKECDLIIHAGDNVIDSKYIYKMTDVGIMAVKGNCDFEDIEEELLFEVEDKIIWSELIGNPNVKWSKRIIERVNRSLESSHAYAVNYNFYKEHVDLALSKGFKPFNTNNLLDNALQYLQQLSLQK
jgi:hypothetical protein